MNREQSAPTPYKALGEKLRAARISRKKTIADASGAIEIDEATFKSIEQGKQRPAEDVLMVLISYLEIAEEEADKLWDLAGYGEANTSQNVIDLSQPVAMMMPMDLRVVYTDMVHVMINDFGVIMNFMQNAGPGNQPLAVARIGMSKTHAKSVLEILDKSLKQADQKRPRRQLKPLNKPTDQTDNTPKG